MTTQSHSRFVVMRHETRDGVHWDLMLEDGGKLASWRLTTAPSSDAAETIAAQQIGRHRRAYLDYEGPVSNDRGCVTRHDAGSFQTIRRDEKSWELEFDGRWLRGRYRLDADDPAASREWTLRPL